MSDRSPLIVSMKVEALVVNDKSRIGQSWMRTPMSYNAMSRGGNGAAQQSSDSNFGSEQPGWSLYYNGVYLKWRLPRALRGGRHDSVSGRTCYRPVPNRWLIVRTGGPSASRTATAWIVESDYSWPGSFTPLNASQEAAFYVAVQNNDTIPYARLTGRNVALAGGSWSESGHSLGLTAVGPGNPAFAFYQPQNNNVFSFIDPLQYENVGPETLSYTVVGWYSSGADDPLANPCKLKFADLLKNELDWTLPADTDSAWSASWSLLYGSIDCVAWQNGARPAGGPPVGNPPVSIAMGNTSVEALTALIAAQAEQALTSIDADLLEAFQLDAVDVLDEPDGAAQLAERIQASFFKKYSAGFTWSLVAAPNETTPKGDFRAIVAELNKDQAALDAAILSFAALRAQLYVAWWKQLVYPIDALGVDSPIVRQSDLTNLITTLSSKVDAAGAALKELLSKVPHGDTQKAIAAAIDVYQQEHDIPSSLRLKRSATPPFHEPNDPVVLIAGAGASGIVDDRAPVLARFPSQVVSGFKATNLTTANLKIPLPDLSGVKGVPWTTELMNALLTEAFLLDHCSATMIGLALSNTDYDGIRGAMQIPANSVGVYPAGAVAKWSGNPWHPLMLMYQSLYYPLPYGTSAAPNWKFRDGEYVLARNATAIAQASLGLSGTLFLAPTASFNMKARLEQFLRNNPNLPAEQGAAFKALLAFVQSSDHWDLLSQALDGFNEQLRLVQTGLFVNPKATDAALADKIGDAATNPPGLGSVPDQGDPTTTSFQPWRAGQFYLTSLIVVDEWGQALYPIDQQTMATEHVYLPPEMSPVLTSLPATFDVVTGVAIDLLSPAVAAANGSQLTLAVRGAGFAPDAAVSLDGAHLVTTYGTPNALTALIPGHLLVAGSHAVTVVSNHVTSPPVAFMVTAKVAIGSLLPSLFQAGSASSSLVPLVVTGANFGPAAVVIWNGTPLVTVVNDAATLTAQIPSTFLAAPASIPVTVESGTASSPPVHLLIVEGPAISGLTPATAITGGGAFTLDVTGVGFSPSSIVTYVLPSGGPLAPLETSFVGPERLTAQVPASVIAASGKLTIVESTGSSIAAKGATSVIQLSPTLLDPARLDFDLISAASDAIVVGPANPGADPICGWVLPNHLDHSLMAYDKAGRFLGEMTIGVEPAICWRAEPSGRQLTDIAASEPHFGPFLLALSRQTPAAFQAFLADIDETLWTTQPIGAVFDKSLAVLVGRPLAMVRASLRLELAGQPRPDPSWQFTLNPATPAVTGYVFAVELGDIARLDDGLVGYFKGDDYATFNVVQEAGATGNGYLKPIGVDGNYLPLPADNATSVLVSMLVDPRAPVHATTGILPTRSQTVPSELVDAALGAMNVTFRLDGVLTDQVLAAGEAGRATMLINVPSEKAGTWSWLENDQGTWTAYATAPNDATARLANTAPVLRQGMLQLSTPFNRKGTRP